MNRELACPRGCTGAPGVHYGSDEEACPDCHDTGTVICVICSARHAVDAQDGEAVCSHCIEEIDSWLAECAAMAMEQNEKGAA